MTNSIWEIIANTPWWVFLLFGYLLWVGFLATKPHQVHIKTLFLFPAFLFIFSLISLISFHFSVTTILIWLGAMLLGASLGWLHYQSLRVRAVQNAQKIYVPGTWVLLFIIIAGFSAKFYFGYEIAINPEFSFQPTYYIAMILLYGLLTGLFFGRFLYARHCLKFGPYLDSTIALT